MPYRYAQSNNSSKELNPEPRPETVSKVTPGVYPLEETNTHLSNRGQYQQYKAPVQSSVQSVNNNNAGRAQSHTSGQLVDDQQYAHTNKDIGRPISGAGNHFTCGQEHLQRKHHTETVREENSVLLASQGNSETISASKPSILPSYRDTTSSNMVQGKYQSTSVS